MLVGRRAVRVLCYVPPMPRRLRHPLADLRLPRWVPCLALLALSGCSTVSYYGQLASGQFALLRAREPAAAVIADPQRDARLRERLAKAEKARQFASERLGLPDNRSYRLYADIGRPYVVWNVFATPELSLQPVTHCFPIAGCVACRGYYSEAAARAEAARQRALGDDVYVGGVQAYSTLGWFDDPILSSMLRWDDERLATLIFHELAHQKFYLRDDTAFNESFATFVEQEGTRQWREYRGLPPADGREEKRREQFTALVLASRARLEALYAGPLDDAAKRAGKAAEFQRLRREYAALSQREWGGESPFKAWIDAPFNNAKLLPFGLYDQWVAAFAALFRQVGGNWPAFYARVRALGQLPWQSARRRCSGWPPQRPDACSGGELVGVAPARGQPADRPEQRQQADAEQRHQQRIADASGRQAEDHQQRQPPPTASSATLQSSMATTASSSARPAAKRCRRAGRRVQTAPKSSAAGSATPLRYRPYSQGSS